MEKFGLLNFEGNVLKMQKKGKDQFVICDQWEKELQTLSRDQLLDFLDGKSIITDSSGKSWNWALEHKDAKPSIKALFTYICGE